MNVLLYAPKNPGNLGNILRTAAAFGLPAVHVFDTYGLLSNQDSRRIIRDVSKGAKTEAIRIESPARLASAYEYRFATTLAKTSKRLGDPDYGVFFPEECLIMFGSESTGLPRELVKARQAEKIVIPTAGMNSCLSLPTSFAVVLYEYFRQHPSRFPRRQDNSV